MAGVSAEAMAGRQSRRRAGARPAGNSRARRMVRLCHLRPPRPAQNPADDRPDAWWQGDHRPHSERPDRPRECSGPDAQQPWRRIRPSAADRQSTGDVADARFAGRDNAVVVERLLSISGEDTLTVNRKYRDQWTGKLPCRLHVLSNEMPKLGDASAAIIGRMVLLVLDYSGSARRTSPSRSAFRRSCPAS